MEKKIHKRKRCSYKPTIDGQRKSLIREVVEHNQKVKEVADKLKIKYSTAKTILRVYKNEGRMNKKKKRAPRRHKGQELPKPIVSDALKILQFPRTLPVPDKLKQIRSSECSMWETIFINRLE